jgi:hypothetical protein
VLRCCSAVRYQRSAGGCGSQRLGEPINSDKPAPEGTADYVTLVMAASPDCTPAGQLDYLLAELTEAQVLRSEVNRKLPTVTT